MAFPVVMYRWWELDCKEGWVFSNWHFQTVVLEKTLESPLDWDEMVGWHHWPNGHENGQTPGVGEGQGGLACCGSWGHKESDMAERLNWTSVLYCCCCSCLAAKSCPILSNPIFWPREAKSQHIGNDADAGKDWRQKEKGTAKDEIIRQHHQLNHLIFCCPLLLLPSIFSSIRVFSN